MGGAARKTHHPHGIQIEFGGGEAAQFLQSLAGHLGEVDGDLVIIRKVGMGRHACLQGLMPQLRFGERRQDEEIRRMQLRLAGEVDGLPNFLFRLIRETEIPVTQVIPTHINRNPQLFEHGLEWAAAGGSVDVTVGPDPEPDDPEVRPEDAIARFSGAGLPLTRMMASSDSNGSLPVFDANGRLVRLMIATERDFFRKFTEIVRTKILPVETAVRVFSTNAAEFYKLGKKGRIEPGRDADLIVLDADLGLGEVIARGKRMIAGGRLLARSTFSN